MTKRILLAFAGAVLLFAAPAHAQGAARDTKALPAAVKGTGELTVLVSTDEQNSRPLRRVSVSIQAGEIDVPNISVTDDDGRVVFRNLAPGNYLLTATRSGYVKTFYGSKLPGRGPGVAVTVLEGQKAGNVQIRMFRGSVLTGTVRTASGRPAPNQAVQAVMVRSSGSERRAVSLEGGLGVASTDDRGVYRIFGLAPGDYIVLVPATTLGSEEMRPVTASELRWADSVVAGGATTAPASGVSPAPQGAPTVAYAPVYFPGTAFVNEAGVITVRPNEERAGMDFSLQLVPTAQITGRVVDPEGRPQNGVSVMMRPLRNDGLDLFASLFNSSARTGTDGTFTMRGVKPGSYTMAARATPKTGAEPAAPPDPAAAMKEAMAAALGGGGANATHWAQEDIAIQGRDVSDLVLTLRPGMTMRGRVVYEATAKTPPADLSTTGLMLMQATTGTGINDLMSTFMGTGNSTTLKIDLDGSFVARGIAPGRYRLNMPFAMMAMAGLPSMAGPWTMKGAIVGGRDISDSPIEVRAGMDVSDVVVTFTDQPSELSGRVLDGAGRVTADFPLVVFSTDRSYWTLGSRRVQTARPSSGGVYKITGLPAGEYFVCAVTAVDRTEVYDPAFLNQLTGASIKIVIKDGEKRTQDLKLGGG